MFEPTQEQRNVVKLLPGYGIPLGRIVKVVRNPNTRQPIKVETLQTNF